MPVARHRHHWTKTARTGIERCAHCAGMRRRLFAQSRRGAAAVTIYRDVYTGARTWTTDRPECAAKVSPLEDFISPDAG